MSQKAVQDTFEFREAMQEFSSATHDRFKDHGFALGYMERFAANMFMTMNAQRRAQFLDDMQTAAKIHRQLAEMCAVSV